ncbi:MAG: hydroxymethylglutaryl-CoA synthase family protein [Phycisphaerae bacterium]|nr:hydroxymethylglutaryl-CoA synthase family protein [Phycisphaerae bacterium]
MIGITSFGGFVPRFRLNRQTIFQAMGWYNAATFGIAQGDKAVASHDEDSITLAAAAAIDALGGNDRGKIAALFAASTTWPYDQREAAAILAAALDLPERLRTVDMADSLRAGTSALLSGLDAVQAGIDGEVLVAAAECRVARPGSVQEHLYGDGAAALVLGNQDVVAEFKGAYSMSVDFADHIRQAGQRFDRTWEERWIRDEGFLKIIPQAVAGLLERCAVKLDDVAKVVFPCEFARAHSGIAKRLGLKPEQVQDPLFKTMGDSGAAHPLVMLVAALQSASPGDKIILASYGQGSDALLFEATDRLAAMTKPRGVLGYLDRKEDIQSYQRYAVFRELVPVEKGIRGEFQAPTAFSTLWRDRRGIMGLVGTKCTACGTPQYPAQRICVKCGAVDKMTDYRFSDKRGKIFTYTGDMLAFSVDPPAVYGIVDIDDGGRLYLDFTDCTLESLKVGMPVEMSFRRKYHDEHRGISGYFWKAVPAQA